MAGRTIAAAAAASLLAAGPGWAESAGRGYGYHMWDGGGWGHFVFGPLMMILFIVVIVAVVVLVVRWAGGAGAGGGARRPGPLDLLDERYASGDIDRDEYLQRKKDLS